MKISVNPMQEQLKGMILEKSKQGQEALGFEGIMIQLLSMMGKPIQALADQQSTIMGGEDMGDQAIENILQSLQDQTAYTMHSPNNEPIQMSSDLVKMLENLMDSENPVVSEEEKISLQNNDQLRTILEKIDVSFQELFSKLQDAKTSQNRTKAESLESFDKNYEELDFALERTSQNKNWMPKNEKLKELQGEKTIEPKIRQTENKNIGDKALNIQSLSSQQPLEYLDQELQQVKIQNIHEVSQEMIKEIELLKDGEHSTLKVKLAPKELGEIEIKIEMKEGQVLGRILVENMAVKGAIENQLQHLKQQLQEQNIVAQKIEVDLQQQSGKNNQEEQASLFWNQESTSKGFSTKDFQDHVETLTEKEPRQAILANSYYKLGQDSSINFLA